MGLLDILNGMQAGPRGKGPSDAGAGAGGTSGGGLSPMSIALLGLLAYKAVKSFSGSKPGQAAAPPPSSGSAGAGTAGGGLGDALGRLFGGSAGGPGGGLGSLLGGAAAGTLVSGGLGTLIKEFQESGHGQAVQSWVGSGPNETIAPNDLANALGGDTLDALVQRTGMKRADLLSGLSQNLPELINQLTPHGRLPTEEEASRMESAP